MPAALTNVAKVMKDVNKAVASSFYVSFCEAAALFTAFMTLATLVRAGI